MRIIELLVTFSLLTPVQMKSIRKETGAEFTNAPSSYQHGFISAFLQIYFSEGGPVTWSPEQLDRYSRCIAGPGMKTSHFQAATLREIERSPNLLTRPAVDAALLAVVNICR